MKCSRCRRTQHRPTAVVDSIAQTTRRQRVSAAPVDEDVFDSALLHDWRQQVDTCDVGASPEAWRPTNGGRHVNTHDVQVRSSKGGGAEPIRQYYTQQTTSVAYLIRIIDTVVRFMPCG